MRDLPTQSPDYVEPSTSARNDTLFAHGEQALGRPGDLDTISCENKALCNSATADPGVLFPAAPSAMTALDWGPHAQV